MKNKAVLSVLLLSLGFGGNALAKCREKNLTMEGTVRIGFEKQIFIEAKSKKEYWIEEFPSTADFNYDEKTAEEQNYPVVIKAKVQCKPVKIGHKTWQESLLIEKVLK